MGDFKIALPNVHSWVSIIFPMLTQQNVNTYMHSTVAEDTNIRKKR